MVKIVQKENSILRDDARAVAEKEIGTAKINKIISDMKIALAREDDGVAIAAPQIGVPLRIFIVSGRVAHLTGQVPEDEPAPEDTVFINPVIKKLSREKKLTDEGCLSVRYLYGKVRRSTKATIEATDESGKRRTFGASGLLAQIFQHEIDHLGGVLFTDKAVDVEEIIPPHVVAKQKNVPKK
jgi:peptide deformylase